MTPEDKRSVFSHRNVAAIIKGATESDGVEVPIVGKSLGEAIVYVSEEGSVDSNDVHVIYGENGSLSYTDCLSLYRDYGRELRE